MSVWQQYSIAHAITIAISGASNSVDLVEIHALQVDYVAETGIS